MNNHMARTLAIVNLLANGKQLTIPKLGTIAMGKDMTIGLVFKKSDGTEYIFGLSTMDLAELNSLLDRYEIGMPIPTK